ncbi:carbon storage regulator CsrA [Sporolactobacillus sp. THM19-2]|uniref:carbon storage regulator CsrA n=1 Tax=Sporolactobacillus sp. THM19-2 TaxID=2511171 RepID=UPI001020D47B|nr:carbon storage regulator CsrA [Sporolactobacillus sp. THM19-2]RYL93676.1 carbon storage regulator [Sporolactobacillus sp. THM19-2]
MLILTRKPGESIRIGEQIKVKVVAVDGDQVKIGIEAPREVDINRSEVYEAIQKLNSQAAVNRPSEDILNALKKIRKK